MAKNINDNLLNSLFISPKPLPEKKEVYYLLFHRIFPDEKNFKKFLSTNNINEQIEISKTLIQRLCFKSNFPPAYDLLINLLFFEDSDINRSYREAYIPQDHFVHIINSYIFGIYLFFYHPVLNRKLTSLFMGIRNEDNINPVLNATKDFVSFWKYFCLFHDIAYPIEAAYKVGEEKIIKKDDKYNDYLKVFDFIPISLFKKWASTALTHFIVVQDLFSDTENKKVEKLFINKKAIFTCITDNVKDLNIKDIKEIFKDFMCIDKLLSYEHFKMLTGFIEKSNIFLVLLDKYTENPIAFKYYNNEKSYIYKIKHYYDDISHLGVEYYLDMEEEYLSDRYQIRFCIKNGKENMEKIYPPYGTETFEEKDFPIIKDTIIKNYEQTAENIDISDINTQFVNISDANELDNYIFQYYKMIYSYCNTIMKDNNIFTQINNNNYIKEERDDYIFSSIYSKMLQDVISNCIFDSLNNRKNNSKLSAWIANENRNENELPQIIDDLINDILLIDNIEKEKENISNKIKEKMKETVESAQINENMLIEIISQIGSVIISNELIDMENQWLFNNAFDFNVFLNKFEKIQNVEIIQNIINKLDLFLSSITNIDHSFNEVVKKYRNDYFALDHGIFSCYIYCLSEYFSYNVLESVFSNANSLSKAIGTFIWPVSYENYKKKLVENYKIVSAEVAKSIFSHNIYTNFFNKSFPNSNWKIDLNSEPCLYFSMLVDALQVWDRKKYYHATIDYKLFFDADSFNISVKNKKLCISLKCNSNKIKDLYDKFRESIDEYLSDASSLIHISFEGI